MNIDIEPGTYVVAVSGGVDSVALLHALQKRSGLKLIVAHFDHGIRVDSALDLEHVQQMARQYGLPFIYDRGNLGIDASEDEARQARYKFLDSVRSASNAQAIIIAHHQDDALETVVLQLLRGTGRRGLSSLGSHLTLLRPLLHVPKVYLKAYAKSNGLTWREDSTNQDERYLRNYVRLKILPKLNPEERQRLSELINRMRQVNQEIDNLLDLSLHMQPSRSSLSRHWFTGLPHSVASEVMAHWLRRHGIRGFDKKHLQKLVVAAKTLAPGQRTDVDKTHILKVSKDILALAPRDR